MIPPIENATTAYEASIRDALGLLPEFVLNAARLSRVAVSRAPERSNQIAQYEHMTRNIYLVPDLEAGLLREAVFHETAHAVDDNFGVGHYFGESPHWISLYNGEESSVEGFAHALVNHWQDPASHRKINGQVAQYCDYALAYLKTYFA